ncbi:MAG: glycoside hydrolase family 99-like domain-containing protein [Saccharofermentanales bacterium]
MEQNESERYNGTVAVWYTSHSQTDPRDWNNIKEFDGQFHPLSGYYKSNDISILRKQLHEMRRAGIDLIVYDCYATANWSIDDLPKDETLKLLMNELSNQGAESRKLKLCIWLEKYALIPSFEQYEFALKYVRDNISCNDFYFYYDGKPLVVTYLNGMSDAIDKLEHGNTFFTLRRIRPYTSDVWSYIEYYPQMLRKGWMSASPGFNSYLEDAYMQKYFYKNPDPDFAAIKEKAPKVDRENGEFYKRQLLWAKKADPKIIFVSGWNDWQYGNHIEPSVEYGYQYVDLTAETLGRKDETAAYR